MLSPDQANQAADALLLKDRIKLEAQAKKREARLRQQRAIAPIFVTAFVPVFVSSNFDIKPVNAALFGLAAGVFVHSIVEYFANRKARQAEKDSEK